MKMTLHKALSLFQFASIDSVTTDKIKKRYLDLAQKKHPDKGGSTQEFIELKDAYAYLKKFVTESGETVSSSYTSYSNTTSNKSNYSTHSTSQSTTNNTKYTADKEYVKQLETVNVELTEQNKKYYSVLMNYESILNKEIEIFNKMSSKLTKIANDFNKSSEKNRVERDKNIEELKKQYSPAFKDLINPFQRRIDNEEFLWRQNSIIQEYEDVKQELESTFLNAMVEVYQSSFETVSELLEKNS